MATCCDQINCSNVSTASNEDDGSLFQMRKGVKKHFLPGDLVQPLGSVETLKGIGGMYGTLNTVQAIWLESKQPIRPEDVAEALWILSRQVPHLQLCLSRRGWRLWFKRMKRFSLDFQWSTKDVLEVYLPLLETRFNLWTGPLWKARLILPESATGGATRGKFTAVLIFVVQHSITDGTTNMRICRETISILNQICTGKQISIVPTAMPPTIDKIVEGTLSLNYLAKYFCKKFTATMLRNYCRKSSFGGALPIPVHQKASTKIIFDDFSKNETKNLLKMCKAAKITVHAFIVTITNFALLTVAQSKSKTPIGERNICVTHCVNMRRYFDPEYIDASGCHISFLEDKTRISLDDAKEFWNVARKVHSSIKEKLEITKEPVLIIPLVQCASMLFPTNQFLTKKGYKSKTDCHYVTTNMGNLKDLLPGPKEGDVIEITYVLRSVSAELTGNPFLLTYHTFRDQLMISIDYYTNKITEETAEEVFAAICKFIRNMANYDALQEFKIC